MAKAKAGRKPMSEAEKAAKKTANAGESKSSKFSRLASARVTKTVKAISLIANLSGSGYEYTQEQVNKIESVLNKSVADTLARFVPREKAAEVSKIEI